MPFYKIYGHLLLYIGYNPTLYKIPQYIKHHSSEIWELNKSLAIIILKYVIQMWQNRIHHYLHSNTNISIAMPMFLCQYQYFYDNTNISWQYQYFYDNVIISMIMLIFLLQYQYFYDNINIVMTISIFLWQYQYFYDNIKISMTIAIFLWQYQYFYYNTNISIAISIFLWQKLYIYTHYIHSVVVQDFVSGRVCCVNQYYYESR